VKGSGRLAAISLVGLGILAFAAVSRGEPPPRRGVDQMAACLSCHDLSASLSARVRHQPAAAGECSACHNPHASRFATLLKGQPGALCGECHGEVQRQLQRPVGHRPAVEGRCASCHEPHGGPHAALLRSPNSELCTSCHGEVGEWQERRLQHGPFAQGRCGVCHEPHGALAPALLKGAEAQICASCHPADARFRQAHRGYPVEQAACHQCHDPHASSGRALLRETLHVPFAGGDCSSCHPRANAATPFALLASQGELCGACHPDQVKASRQAAFSHLSAGGGSCTECHNPHAGEGAALLRGSLQRVCLTCHDPGGARSGLPGRRLTHGREMECTACHAPHGGAEPLLLARESVELCASCHTHQHNVRHPLGEGTLDPRTGAPMTCLTCHGIHDAPYEFALHLSGDRDLCISCHRDQRGSGR
jgi:predicted CXXCH cytochrome family protein